MLTQNVVRIQVSTDFLCRLLSFPDKTHIIACNGEKAFSERIIELTVGHPDLPKVEIGEIIPLCSPIYQKINFDWNLPNPE